MKLSKRIFGILLAVMVWLCVMIATVVHVMSTSMIEVSAATVLLSTPTITSPTTSGSYVAGSDITFKWNAVSGADYYKWAVKDLTTDKLIDSSDDYSKYTTTSITVDGDDLIAGHKIKFTVGGYGDDGEEPKSWASVEITIGNKKTLATPTISSHSDKQHLDAGKSVTVKWSSVSNAENYEYAIKRLDGEPNRDDDEAGALLTNKITTGTSVTISASDFKAGSWYKIAVRACTTKEGYESGLWVYLYLYADTVLLSTPTITSPTTSGSYVAGSDITFKWNTVSGADYYKWAVKDLTTDKLIDSSDNYSKYTKTSIIVDGDDLIAGHKIKFTVGGYGDDGEEPKSWASVEITIAENQLIYTDIIPTMKNTIHVF